MASPERKGQSDHQLSRAEVSPGEGGGSSLRGGEERLFLQALGKSGLDADKRKASETLYGGGCAGSVPRQMGSGIQNRWCLIPHLYVVFFFCDFFMCTPFSPLHQTSRQTHT